MKSRIAKSFAVIAAVLLGQTTAGVALDWPQKPVTVVVPFGAGGNTDTMARIASQRLQEKLGQPFVVDNRGGAGGAIATGQVARATPDGYTLIFAAAPQIAIVPLLQKVSYDPLTDLVPISIFGTGPFILGIHKSVPAQTLPEFIAYAKANSGKINYGSGGAGTTAHLAGALFASRVGFSATHIPYKGGGQAVADFIAGQTQMYFSNASELIQANTTGEIRILAVASEKRMAQLPGIPAISETLPGFHLAAWNGFMAPRETPRDIVDLLAKEIAQIAREPDVSKRLIELGITPIGDRPEEFEQTIKDEMLIFKAAVQAAGLVSQR